ncbi:glycosyltransferase [Halorubrum ezzemoulense]|uniref:glycosyltransferase family 2 protein n=1 Tax=Halorubrum ezzemoulense TaxID=337243 RepID=UPI00232EAAF7|nr:glycosyltransferase [Halorubrum ezzemoulense]MDB2286710.1 glycosyltransferase [Halorubrum ezzemoulense]
MYGLDTSQHSDAPLSHGTYTELYIRFWIGVSDVIINLPNQVQHMNESLVSVVIPSYNRPAKTQRAISSVISQTYEPIELFVIDDGSDTPISENITFPGEEIYNTEYIRYEKNQGANVARNTGIKSASGKYIAFLDSDDEWEDEKIEQQVNLLSGTDKVISYTGIKHLNEKGQINNISKAKLSGDLSKELLQKNVLGTFSSIMAPKYIFDKTGPLDPKLPCYQDWEWYLRASDFVTFEPIPDPLTVKHDSGGRISKNFHEKYEVAYPRMKSKLKARAPTKLIQKKAVSGLDFRLGYSALSNEEYSFGRRFFLRSIQTNPTAWQAYMYLLLCGPHINIVRKAKRMASRLKN